MLDDHKYSLRRVVVYLHREPGHPAPVYGPGGPDRTYGLVADVHSVRGERPHWEYTIRNSFTGEVRRVPEDEIFHGANRDYLDFRRRDGISWSHWPPESARNDVDSGFWKHTLRQFVRTAVPKLRAREKDEEKERVEGRRLLLGPGDYIRVRGDLRQEMETHHNLYAKVLSVSAADREHLEIPRRRPGIASGKHKLLVSYHVLFDDGNETEIYDVEVKIAYTTHGRTIVLNWRAVMFLAEAFGDDPPYDLQMEYLNGHVFTRSELEGMDADDLADLLVRLLYAKGQITWEEFAQKAESLSKSPHEYLVDQVLATSRFDMQKNRPLTQAEIEHSHSEDERLRGLFE